MIRLLFVLAILCCMPKPLIARETQEQMAQPSLNTDSTSVAQDGERPSSFATWLTRLKNFPRQCQLGLARLQTGRDLKFRSGAYWVDNCSRLIDSRGLESGFWGLDSFDRQTFR